MIIVTKSLRRSWSTFFHSALPISSFLPFILFFSKSIITFILYLNTTRWARPCCYWIFFFAVFPWHTPSIYSEIQFVVWILFHLQNTRSLGWIRKRKVSSPQWKDACLHLGAQRLAMGMSFQGSCGSDSQVPSALPTGQKRHTDPLG